jgi:putative acetyltransferase
MGRVVSTPQFRPMPDSPTSPIVLRRARPADAAAFAAQLADASVFGNLMQMPWPSDDLWRQRLEASVAAKESAEVLLVAERDGQLLGSLGLHPVDRVRRRHAAMLGISVGAAHQRQGVGSALMQGAYDYADGWAHLLRLELTGSLSLAAHRRYRALLADLEHQLLDLRLKGGCDQAPQAEELAALTKRPEDPLISRVAQELQARLARQEGNDGEAAAVSRAALCELFRLATSP